MDPLGAQGSSISHNYGSADLALEHLALEY
jgi:hypothetical protein